MDMALGFIAACIVVYALVWSVRTSGNAPDAGAAHGHGGHH